MSDDENKKFLRNLGYLLISIGLLGGLLAFSADNIPMGLISFGVAIYGWFLGRWK